MTIRKIKSAFEYDVTDLKLPDIRAFMSDVMTSDNKTAPITCGFFKQEAGSPCPYTYEAEEFKILLQGELSVTNDRGESFDMKPGEILFFSKGEKVKFSSRSSGLAFYVAQR